MGDTICPVHVCLCTHFISVCVFNPCVSKSVLVSKVMGLILLPLSRPSPITPFSLSISFSPASSSSPLLASQTLSLPLLPSFPPSFPPWWCHSLIKQQACFPLGGFMAGGLTLCLSPSLSPLFSSLHLCPLVFLSLLLQSSSPSPSERDYRIRGNVFSWKICCNFQNGCFA